MFNKISNIDLLNKINSLEHKIDIITCQLNNNTFVGCCDCKLKETNIYNELKAYINDKNEELYNQIIIKLDQINFNLADELFNNYKTDIMNNLDNIMNNITHNNNEISNKNKENDLYTLISTVDTKLNSLFYENEIIKHQLLIEDELRKYSDEISSLKTEIKNVLDDINSIVNGN